MAKFGFKVTVYSQGVTDGDLSLVGTLSVLSSVYGYKMSPQGLHRYLPPVPLKIRFFFHLQTWSMSLRCACVKQNKNKTKNKTKTKQNKTKQTYQPRTSTVDRLCSSMYLCILGRVLYDRCNTKSMVRRLTVRTVHVWKVNMCVCGSTVVGEIYTKICGFIIVGEYK